MRSLDTPPAYDSLNRVITFLIGLLGAAVVAGSPAAPTNSVPAPASAATAPAGTDEATEKEYHKLMELDDAAAAEVDGWIQENQKFAQQGAAIPPADLNKRILARFEPVR